MAVRVMEMDISSDYKFFGKDFSLVWHTSWYVLICCCAASDCVVLDLNGTEVAWTRIQSPLSAVAGVAQSYCRQHHRKSVSRQLGTFAVITFWILSSLSSSCQYYLLYLALFDYSYYFHVTSCKVWKRMTQECSVVVKHCTVSDVQTVRVWLQLMPSA